MKKALRLPIQQMTPALMRRLEQLGMIIRISPGEHETSPQQGEIGIKQISQTDEKFGPHLLLSATINRSQFSAFGTHPDNEEVYLIGDPNTKPLFFLFGLSKRADFEAKIANGNISSDDFLCFKAQFNDAEVSCFEILNDIPHGEATIQDPGKPPTFFVTEPAWLPLDRLSLEELDIYLDDEM